MKRRAMALALGAITLAMTLAPGVLATDRPVTDAGPSTGQFTTVCAFSHRLKDDPIVAPGRPGASHWHDFFGNRTTNANSTYRSLLDGDTSCRREGDTAAYWVPALALDGHAVRPFQVTAYYQARGKAVGSIESFPPGLKLIAGDSMATTAQPLRIAAWRCAGIDGSMSATVPTCPDGSHLVLRIRFPDCWNGRQLDSADHKSHLAYNVRGACPSTHPVGVPGIALNVHYRIAGGDGVTLASGSAFSGHADFFNAWDRKTLARLVERCLNGNIVCGQT